MDESIRGRRALDFFMGAGFAALGLYVVLSGFEAFHDPLLATVDKSTNPGSTTIVIGSLLAIMGVIIGGIGFLGCNKRPFSTALELVPQSVGSRKFFKGTLVLVLIAVYFFILWQAVPFWLSTSLFLIATMKIYKAGAWWKIFLITAISVGLIYYIFAVLAYVPLPTEFFWQRITRQ